MKGAGFDYMII